VTGMNALRIVQSQTVDVPTVSTNASNAIENDEREENVVRRSIQEFCALHKDMHDLRENLVAMGVPTQTLTVLIEMGFNDRFNEQEQLMLSCLSEIGGGHVDEKIKTKFQMQLQELTNLEHDMAHARKIARESGLSLPALNGLTNMIRQNPGDGGEKVVNSFLAYAIAAEIPLEGIDDILATAKERPKSVLPVIDRDVAGEARKSRITLVRDLVLGFVLASTLLLILT